MMVLCERNMWHVWKNRLINQYVCCHWRSTRHLSQKCHTGMSKINLYPSCGTTCSECWYTCVKCCWEFVLIERSVQTASFPTEKRVFIVINEDNSHKWWKQATWWLSSSQKSKDTNFSSLNPLAPLSEKTQISETRFKKLFLTRYEFSDTGGSLQRYLDTFCCPQPDFREVNPGILNNIWFKD